MIGFQTENTEIYMDKAIPLFHLISNLMSLIERYHRNLARIQELADMKTIQKQQMIYLKPLLI